MTIFCKSVDLKRIGRLHPGCIGSSAFVVFANWLTRRPATLFRHFFVLPASIFFCLACVFLGFEHFFSFLFVRSCSFAHFLLAHFLLLFSGPKLEFLLFWSVSYARKAILTAFLRMIRRFFCVSMLSQTLIFMTPFFAKKHPCGNHVNVHKDSVCFCRFWLRSMVALCPAAWHVHANMAVVPVRCFLEHHSGSACCSSECEVEFQFTVHSSVVHHAGCTQRSTTTLQR